MAIEYNQATRAYATKPWSTPAFEGYRIRSCLHQRAMSKNLVLCLDGTGNQFERDNTNVLKLHKVLEHIPGKQLTFYAPGVGTFSPTQSILHPFRVATKLLGLGFGAGYRRSIEDAYGFLMENYEENDRIFLFGYSRGAYMARIVAALIHAVGLLRPGNRNLIQYALEEIEMRQSRRLDFQQLGRFRKQFSRRFRTKPFVFLGLWDTVSSVSWAYDYLTYAFTASNPSVDVIRHAVSIDERRAFFARNLFTHRAGQDTKEVWFAGSHGDVGGGYPESDNGLSKITLEWMIHETSQIASGGLRIDNSLLRRVLTENDPPRIDATVHNSMTWRWWWAELFPKSYTGFPIPRPHFFRRRRIQARANSRNQALTPRIHASVIERTKLASLNYAPANLPKTYTIEPHISLLDNVDSEPDSPQDLEQ